MLATSVSTGMTPDYQTKQTRNHLAAFLKAVDKDFLPILKHVAPRTMLSVEALYDLYLSTQYCVRKGLRGDICELGVWRGGALELVAHTLFRLGAQNRIVGIDTFEGHPMPGPNEVDIWGNNMRERYERETADGSRWAYAGYQNVLSNVKNIYPNVLLIKQEVNDSFSADVFSAISILRLDMDWYAPTRIALNRLFPKVEKGGCLIIDDYGHHSGCRDAVDEYLREQALVLNLRHVNYSCVAATIP